MPTRPKIYRLRQVARFFAIVGVATVVYSSVLVGITFRSGIVEF
ncbi:MAG: hypothetical protein O3B76_02875 [Proteobacteria bacterium]|nr:hypothetical protein [Pseudomonadota bacterium]MDA1022077.1 hypothetical protein [Pseudomonadota bacterium]